jgi:type II restriction/modification system DNA methylase subunit YeeA
MDTKALEKFAQAARRQLIDEVGSKLEQVLQTDSAELREKANAIQQLREQIKASSKQAVIDRVAYTWFNRFCALRFMDANHYTSVGIVSPLPGHTQPEILQDTKQGHIAEDLKATVDSQRVFALLSGELASSNPQQEAYRLLLVGVCNQYHKRMPFLFERINDYTELLMPDDLLSEESILYAMRQAMTVEVCEDIEVIGWLYQFYISEKKDQVIGKVVKSEDIPAATQLFTPNWIVKYMVQNSLGAQWLATYPNSRIRDQMEYYIEPAEQTPEVQQQLREMTPDSLNPEALTLIDPASGSGHILVEAYELFKAIYLERGYQRQEVAQLILEKNLFGLEICPRAAQLTGFALMMKGRADDRRFFERGVKLNVMALQDSTDFDAGRLAQGVTLADYGLQLGDLTELKRLFEHATTFGSLIQVPEGLAKKLPALKKLSESSSQDLFVSDALKRLAPLVQQAELLATQYDAVVANPPYMGGKFQTPILKKYLKGRYKGYEKDFFSAFIDRDLAFSKPHGCLGFMSPFVWMFISSYEHLRTRLIDKETVTSLVQLEYSGFEGATVPICTFTLQKGHVDGQRGCYIRLSDFRGSENQGPKTFEAIRNRDCGWFFEAAQDEFKKIPGSPVAYWVSESMRAAFASFPRLDKSASPRKGMVTADNPRFIRCWHEVSLSNTGHGFTSRDAAADSQYKWFPYTKGGSFRRWAGNYEHVVNWGKDGNELLHMQEEGYKVGSTNHNLEFIFRPALTWTKITSSDSGFRVTPAGFLFDDASGVCPVIVGGAEPLVLALLNSPITIHMLRALNPTLNLNPGNLCTIPLDVRQRDKVAIDDCIEFARKDWDAYERSWDFQSLPILTASSEPSPMLESSYTAWITQNRGTIAKMKRLEEENNRLFIDAYGLQDELTPDVPIEQITLTVNPAYRYGLKGIRDKGLGVSQATKSSSDPYTMYPELEIRFRQDTMEEFISYAVGCMLGRYSLDKPGLILANQGDTIAEYLKQVPEPTFMPDKDNVIPILDGDWFTDDIVDRFCHFLKVTFGDEHYQENLAFIENALGKPLRKYFLKDFYASHIKRYKKRPIYWLFSSPKGSFNALIYMHRYTPDTASIVLNDYLREFRAKLTGRKQHLEQVSISGSASSREKTAALREIEKLKTTIAELETYETETLYPLATQRIEIDLDDGVKVNYNKFGNALKKIKGLSKE